MARDNKEEKELGDWFWKREEELEQRYRARSEALELAAQKRDEAHDDAVRKLSHNRGVYKKDVEKLSQDNATLTARYNYVKNLEASWEAHTQVQDGMWKAFNIISQLLEVAGLRVILCGSLRIDGGCVNADRVEHRPAHHRDAKVQGPRQKIQMEPVTLVWVSWGRRGLVLSRSP